jgi:hypothetical protein
MTILDSELECPAKFQMGLSKSVANTAVYRVDGSESLVDDWQNSIMRCMAVEHAVAERHF